MKIVSNEIIISIPLEPDRWLCKLGDGMKVSSNLEDVMRATAGTQHHERAHT